MTRRRFVLLATPAGGVLLGVAGYHPTRVLAGAAGVQAMVLAQATVLAVVILTVLPALRRIPEVGPAERLRIALKAAATRFFVTVPIAGMIAWRWPVHPAAFLTWIGITYVIAIHVETVCLVRWMKELGQRDDAGCR